MQKSVKENHIDVYSQEECSYFKDNFNYVHIDFGLNSYNNFYRDIYKFLKCNIPINNFYFAREPYKLMKEKNAKLLYELYNKSLDNNTLILVYGKNMSLMMAYAYKMSGGNITLLSNKEINFLEKAEIKYYEIGEKVNNIENDVFVYGWYGSEQNHRWSNGNESIIILPIYNKEGDVKLSLELMPYLNEKIKEQYIKFVVGNDIVYEGKMDKGYKKYQFIVPNKYIIDNIINIKIQLQNPASSPSEVGYKDRRKLGVSSKELIISR